MTDLRLSDVIEALDPEWNGYLPDVFVGDVGLADWQSFLDLADEQRWAREVLHADGAPWPRVAALFPGGAPLDEPPTLAMRPFAGVQVNVYPHAVDEIAFDVDLRELDGQAGLDRLCGLLRLVGRRLSRDVPLFAEGDASSPVLRYDRATDSFWHVEAP
ncbi:hypothetical protein [Oerskovia paurometabola]|uniref:hypothetical protein n=1 Tax=Oerskovia paurometabola TaxID=162170 RepID=UPI003426EE86